MAWLAGYDKRIKLDIDYTNKIGGSVIWFPVTIHLKDANGDSTKVFEELGSNGGKIAITKADGITELKGEVEQWNYNAGTPANSVAIIHTSLDGWTIDGDTSIYLYYDNDHALNPNIGAITGSSPASDVWNANYKMVQHLEDYDTSNVHDSTSNGNDGVKPAANTPEETDGKIGKGQLFDAAGDKITEGQLNIPDELTVEAWIKPSALGTYQRVVCEGNWNTEWLLGITDWNPGAGRENYIDFTFYDGASKSVRGVTTLVNGNWYHIVFTYSKSGLTAEVYLQGASDRDSYAVSNSINDSGADLLIGKDAGGNPFAGIIDEVRVSNVARSAAWIKGSYNSGNDSLLTYRSEEIFTPTSPNFTDKNNYNGYNAFIQQYIRHKINATTPWKNPDGTLL